MLERRRFWATIVVLGVVSFFPAGPVSGEGENTFDKKVPPFREVFIKLFRIQVEIMSMDQLKTTSTTLTDAERAAISHYLGEDGHKAVREGIPEEKQKFLDEKFALAAGEKPAGDFQKMYPHILAVANNTLTTEQMAGTIHRLTAEELASQSFYLEEKGRAKLFTEMTEDRVQIILDSTEDWVFIDTGKKKYDTIKGYTCILYKQELLEDGLQGVEKILVKFREKPQGIYMKWLDGPWKGREALYSEKALGAGKVRVREAGFLGVIAVTLDVTDSLAQRGSNHMMTELGLKYLLGLIEENYRAAIKNNDVKRNNHGIVDLDGTRVFKMETILSKDKSKGYYCYRMYHYIDFKKSLEIKAEVYNHDDQFSESYYYTQIQLNPGLTDRDFDPKNPDYNL